MSQPGNEDAGLNKWLTPLLSLELEEFCQRWIPIIYEVSGEDRRYSALKIEFICQLTKRTEKTVRNWFARSQKVPDDVKSYLGAVDALWRISLIIDQIAPRPEKPDD